MYALTAAPTDRKASSGARSWNLYPRRIKP